MIAKPVPESELIPRHRIASVLDGLSELVNGLAILTRRDGRRKASTLISVPVTNIEPTKKVRVCVHP